MHQQRISTRLQEASTAQPTDETVDLQALISMLWRGKWLIATVTAILVLLGGYYVYELATPTYKATSVLLLEPQQENIVSFESVVSDMAGTDGEVNSEVEVLRSRELMKKVVEKLSLTDDPEFNPHLRAPSITSQAKKLIKTTVFRSSKELNLENPAEEVQRELDDTISTALRAITIRSVPNSYVLQVSAETESAKKSALLSDTVADQYILDQISTKYNATEQASTWLSERVVELQDELEDAETELAEFSGSIDLVSPEALQTKERQIKDLRDRIVSVGGALEVNENLISALNSAPNPQKMAAVSQDAKVKQLAKQLQANPENPIIQKDLQVAVDNEIRRVELEAGRNKNQLQTLQSSLDTQTREYEAQSQDLIKLQQLTRETEASRLLYEYFLGRLKETSVQQGIQKADARVISYGVVPSVPAAPNTTAALMMSAISGLLIGAAIVVWQEMQRKTFRTAHDLQQYTGYSVLGQIPLFPNKARSKVIEYLDKKPNSAAVEAVRNLRTAILLSNVDHPPKVIMMTSALPGEGKTTLTLALANNLSGMGQKVLVIEGDIRRRVFGQYRADKETPQKGLVSVLSEGSAPEDLIVHDTRIGADLLLSEPAAGNAADLFSSKKFAELIENLRQKYDKIIIDTPPVLIVPDARVIAQNVDSILFVVGWDRSEQSQVADALLQLEQTNSKPAGLVLNQISLQGMKKYGYGGRYGSYAAYGSKYYTN
ncbi:polysaccharide biosynthesis tyrosine autokinase [Mangrovicoccus sp. HB161399]|uniref:polysaccharide biosynthesis tyrosine autokinase n=1 Tax=Mangrovicoccus sp. HB161399 TaxID=2720392 RepID=UPI001557C2FF|nr:polysaccharide biosynthesis tyrosine autokinase [Mangrovicoccus sp. HB161399]